MLLLISWGKFLVIFTELHLWSQFILWGEGPFVEPHLILWHGHAPIFKGHVAKLGALPQCLTPSQPLLLYIRSAPSTLVKLKWAQWPGFTWFWKVFLPDRFLLFRREGDAHLQYPCHLFPAAYPFRWLPHNLLTNQHSSVQPSKKGIFPPPPHHVLILN